MKLDPDIARVSKLPVSAVLQERVRQLIQVGKIPQAINEICIGAGYGRRDGRSVVLALLYDVKVPTS